MSGILTKSINKKGTPAQQRYAFCENFGKTIFKPGMSLLDIGCGDGVFSHMFRKIGYSIETADIQDKAFPWKHQIINIDEQAPVGKFDVIIFTQILEHVENPEAAIENVLKCAKPSSIIVVSVPNFTAPNHLRTYSRKKFRKFIDKYLSVKKEEVFPNAKNNSKCFLVVGSPI
jgi:2-polyprenyl-3-methyl-5-hydroxy-6-metoxy-1,4-benzoquinol methylase